MATARRVRPPDLFLARCPPAAVVGDMVYISGERTGDVYEVDRCNITQAGKRPWGMIVSKPSADSCIVQTNGEVRGLYSSLTPGGPLFLGPGVGARLTHTPPGPALSGRLYQQIAGQASATDRLYLGIQAPVVLVAT